MRKFLDIFAKKIEVAVVTEPIPDFSKEMVIIETPEEEDEKDDDSQN